LKNKNYVRKNMLRWSYKFINRILNLKEREREKL